MTTRDRLVELYAVPQDADQHALAVRYAPLIQFDTNEPFFPLAAGYTIIRADQPSPSFPRMLTLADPQRASASIVIEYAIWWDWDIGHLYELEHAWVYLDAAGRLIAAEASSHGGYHRMQVDGQTPVAGDRLILYSEPGKHAFAPSPAWFNAYHEPHPRATTRELAGLAGVLVTDLFTGKIVPTPYQHLLARSYLAGKAFTPAWDFAQTYTFEPQMLVPWPALEQWIPPRLTWWLDELATTIEPAAYRPLRIGHRSPPLGGNGNTLAGLQRAVTRGFDLIGVDLGITADGVLVASRTPLVYDQNGRSLPIALATYAELAALADASAQIATLPELCTACEEQRIGMYLTFHDQRAIAPALACLRNEDKLSVSLLAAARLDWLTEIKALDAAATTVLQCESYRLDLIMAAQVCSADYVHLCFTAYDQSASLRPTRAWLDQAHAAGLGVIGWYSEDPGLELLPGLDGICTPAAMAPPTPAERSAHSILAVCIDFGDTLADEATEIKDSSEITQRADLIPGADALVRELSRRGYRLALVADGRPGTYRNVLGQHGLYDYFDVFAISDHTGSLKPEPHNFDVARSLLGLHADDYPRIMMVGNNLAADVKGAKALGMTSVWLDWSPRRAKIPADASEVPTYTIRLPLELLEILE